MHLIPRIHTKTNKNYLGIVIVFIMPALGRWKQVDAGTQWDSVPSWFSHIREFSASERLNRKIRQAVLRE